MTQEPIIPEGHQHMALTVRAVGPPVLLQGLETQVVPKRLLMGNFFFEKH